VGGGFLGIMLGGGMPMLQHPNPIGNVFEGCLDFRFTDAAGRPVNGNLQSIVTQPNDLLGFGVGEECATAHARVNLVTNQIKFQKTDWQGVERFQTSGGSFLCFPLILG